jgi:hypothetical protein
MFPDPVKQPRYVRELLLQGCEEVLRRAGFGPLTAASPTSKIVEAGAYTRPLFGST